MESVVQWATILSPIIAVVIAWLTSRSSSKDTAKKLVALEESTNKQVESIKELTRKQIEVALIQMRRELWEAREHYVQISRRESDEFDRAFSNHWVSGMEAYYQREDKRKDLSDSREFLSKQIQILSNMEHQIDEMSKKIGEK